MTPGETASHTPNDAHLINKDIYIVVDGSFGRRHLEKFERETNVVNRLGAGVLVN
jgi:CRP-like cAMP-binding protein